MSRVSQKTDVVQASIDAEALWEDLIALGEITEPGRPYTRRSFSPLFLQGRAWLTQRMQAVGLATRIDAGGNLIGRRAGKSRPLSTLMIGSHSDSVPSGGRFDGMAGVAVGIAIARSLYVSGIELEHSLEIVDYLAEEPSEFGLSCVGSRAMAGELMAEHLTLSNVRGEQLAAALTAVGGDPLALATARRNDIVAAFELHIEQGPVLEATQTDVGIVSSIVGITRVEVEFTGTAGHAGTTPMDARRDPLLAAAGLIGWVHATARGMAQHGAGHFVATVGVIEAKPGASNVIPKSVRLIIDARAEHRSMLEDFMRLLEAASAEAAGAANVECSALRRLSDTRPSPCNQGLQASLRASAAALGLSSRDMASGAGHDTAFVSHVAPAALLFIACKGGRSHTPEEWAERDALAAGATVILKSLLAVDSGATQGATVT